MPVQRKLYFSAGSPYARIIRILLHELGLEFERDQIDRVRTEEEIASLNPCLAIPVLEDQGQTLFDTKVIASWLLSTYSPRPGVDAAFIGAMYRQDHRWSDMQVTAAIETLSETMVALYLYGRDGEAAGIDIEQWPYVQRQRSRMNRILDWLDQQFTPDGRAPGAFTFQDIALISVCVFTELRGIHEMTGRPSVDGTIATFADRPSIIETRPV